MGRIKTMFGASLLDDTLDSDKAGHRTPDGRTPQSRPSVDSGEDAPDWLAMARNFYEDSTTFMESSLRWQWERNERAFQSQHPNGSKYLSQAFRGRSKLFRPKTRATMRQAEAGAAAAYFANEDVVSIRAVDESSPEQVLSASVNHHLMKYRMTTPNKRVAIPWYLTLMGAFQDARKYGFCASRQSWEYEEIEETVKAEVVDQTSGDVLEPAETKRRVLLDRPRIDLIPPENIRIDRAGHWMDPINTSPMVQILWPMYVADVEARMKTGVWKHFSRSQLLTAASRHAWDSTRVQREGNREDSKEISAATIREFSTVWAHEIFVRWEGRDYVYYTAGIHNLLSEPRPIKEIYHHADDYMRPVTMGYALVETHKANPSGTPQLTEQLQSEANEIANLRLDNIKLALNKRYKVKRGRKVDLRSLIRNVPGSITLVQEIDDVEFIETKDVTQSSYREQDRLNVDFDDVAGNFSPGTVQTNRSMNETVGGMQMLSGAAVTVGEMDQRTFNETWAEPTLVQVMKMIQIYETDETILNIAAKQAQAYTKLREVVITDDLINQDLFLRCNVGIGATDPMHRLQKLGVAADAVQKLFGASIMQKANVQEIIKEIFGPLGYRDGSRFFNFEDDPKTTLLLKKIQELTKKLDTKELERAAKVEVARLGAESRILQQALENDGKLKQSDVEFLNELNLRRIDASRAAAMAAAGHDSDRQLEQDRNIGAMNMERIRATGRSKSSGADT